LVVRNILNFWTSEWMTGKPEVNFSIADDPGIISCSVSNRDTK
jgi:hypothetical protein